MTAQELYEIVKDIPAEAWPDLTFHEDEDQWSTHPFVACRGPVNIHLAESVFVGAMVRHLPNVEIRYQSHENSVMLYTVTVTIGWEDRWFRAPLLVEALAAACKEAK